MIPSTLFSFSRYVHIPFRDCGSSPVVGSSRNQKFRLVNQTASELEPLLHPSGVPARGLSCYCLEFDEFEQFVGAL